MPAGGIADVRGDQGGGPRQERDRHQEHHVQHQERVRCAPNELEHVVVIDPDDPDREEADDVPGIGWPDVDDIGPQSLPRDAGDLHLQDQEGDRDGDHAVGERLQAARLRVHVPQRTPTFGLPRAAPPAGSRRPQSRPIRVGP